MKNPLQYLTLLIFLCLHLKTDAQQAPPPKTRILFILDASGSMYDVMDGKTRIVLAKEILSNLIDSLRDQSNLEVALRVFGHQFDRKYNNCKDTKLEVPFIKENHDQIINKIKSLDPKGTTLIAHSILQAADDFPKDPNVRNVIILITDGIESCGGDPCAISLALQKKNIFLKPFIIGLGSDPDFKKAFSCMGEYYDANDKQTFRNVLDRVMSQALGRTTVRVNLLDSFNNPKETNVNVTFVNNITGQPVYDFVHFIGSNGMPDFVEVDPVITYDIVVNTIPQVIKKGISLEGGKENTINIKSPQGNIYFKSNHSEYKHLSALIRNTSTDEILNSQSKNTFDRYLVGSYNIEILSLPRITLKNVKVEQSKTTTIDIPQPGVLSILDNVPGYGSIYLLKESGEQEWVTNLENDNSKSTITLQPGDYKLVFRSKKASGSKYTDIRNFTINTGATTTIKLYKF